MLYKRSKFRKLSFKNSVRTFFFLFYSVATDFWLVEKNTVYNILSCAVLSFIYLQDSTPVLSNGLTAIDMLSPPS